ncbi:putative T7SS-secreted protein [Streptomyces sp. SCSIO ZS0520]|uniref:putative T7SS-secreted protein n=1 Tax=Streptomyces sp. SCSIO ZS0520 TaxID=2892996 RepID=UPI0021DA1B49|nr:enoyl-CoA hydratase/isomerase family protein [Streptomyces sp. SCSIO ZS0520]
MTRPPLPNIGRDPTPGDVQETKQLARKIDALATDFGTTVSELTGISAGDWKGKTARSFSDHVDEDLTPLFKKAHKSFDKAARALKKWAHELQDFQDETDRLEAAAKKAYEAEAKEKAEDGKHAKDKKGADTAGKGDAEPAADDGLDVQGCMDWLHDLDERYAAAAKRIAEELDKAGDIAPDEPGLFDKIGNAFKSAADWVKDHADLIKLVGDLLSDLSGILGFLAIITMPFEPLGLIFGAAALVTTGLALGAHGLAMAAGADVGWATLGLDAVGLLPGIGAFGKGAKVADLATATARAAKLGKGFKATKLATSKVPFAFGKAAEGLEGGLRLGNKVVLGGTAKNMGLVFHESSGLMSRMAGISQAGYREGQFLGSKGWNMLPFGGHVNPEGALARGIDAGMKIAPKGLSIPQHVGEALHPGDSFHESAGAH